MHACMHSYRDRLESGVVTCRSASTQRLVFSRRLTISFLRASILALKTRFGLWKPTWGAAGAGGVGGGLGAG